MMRRPLLLATLLVALLAPGVVSAASNLASLTHYTFQQGVSPTSGYTGMSDTYVGGALDSAGKYNFGQSTELRLASIASTTEAAIFLKCKFMASEGVTGGLPANFVIDYAAVSLYKTNLTNGDVADAYTAPNNQAWMYRMMQPWVEGTGGDAGHIGWGECRSAHSGYDYWGFAADSAYQYDFQLAHARALRTGTASQNAGGGEFTTDTATVITNWFGADTLWTAVSGDANLAMAIPGSSESFEYLKTSSNANVLRHYGWNTFPATRQFKLWYSGANANYGFQFTNSTAAATKTFIFASSQYGTTSWEKLRRPRVDIWGHLEATTTTTASPRKGIGSGLGRR